MRKGAELSGRASRLPRGQAGGSGSVRLPFLLEGNPQLLHPGPQGVRVDPQKLPRSSGTVDLPPGHAQNPSYVGARRGVQVEWLAIPASEAWFRDRLGTGHPVIALPPPEGGSGADRPQRGLGYEIPQRSSRMAVNSTSSIFANPYITAICDFGTILAFIGCPKETAP